MAVLAPLVKRQRARAPDARFSATLSAAETTAPELGPDIEKLALAVSMPAPGVVRVRITDAHVPRWEVPQWLFAQGAVAGALSRAGSLCPELHILSPNEYACVAMSGCTGK